jgi:hypothetical protein
MSVEWPAQQNSFLVGLEVLLNVTVFDGLRACREQTP